MLAQPALRFEMDRFRWDNMLDQSEHAASKQIPFCVGFDGPFWFWQIRLIEFHDATRFGELCSN
jgi:hypothetical protein